MPIKIIFGVIKLFLLKKRRRVGGKQLLNPLSDL